VDVRVITADLGGYLGLFQKYFQNFWCIEAAARQKRTNSVHKGAGWRAERSCFNSALRNEYEG
jgi:hypothetical protein